MRTQTFPLTLTLCVLSMLTPVELVPLSKSHRGASPQAAPLEYGHSPVDFLESQGLTDQAHRNGHSPIRPSHNAGNTRGSGSTSFSGALPYDKYASGGTSQARQPTATLYNNFRGNQHNDYGRQFNTGSNSYTGGVSSTGIEHPTQQHIQPHQYQPPAQTPAQTPKQPFSSAANYFPPNSNVQQKLDFDLFSPKQFNNQSPSNYGRDAQSFSGRDAQYQHPNPFTRTPERDLFGPQQQSHYDYQTELQDNGFRPILAQGFSVPTTYQGQQQTQISPNEAFSSVTDPKADKRVAIGSYVPSNTFVNPSNFLIPTRDKYNMVTRIFGGFNMPALKQPQQQQQPQKHQQQPQQPQQQQQQHNGQKGKQNFHPNQQSPQSTHFPLPGYSSDNSNNNNNNNFRNNNNINNNYNNNNKNSYNNNYNNNNNYKTSYNDNNNYNNDNNNNYQQPPLQPYSNSHYNNNNPQHSNDNQNNKDTGLQTTVGGRPSSYFTGHMSLTKPGYAQGFDDQRSFSYGPSTPADPPTPAYNKQTIFGAREEAPTLLFSDFSYKNPLSIDQFRSKNLLGDESFGKTDYDKNRLTPDILFERNNQDYHQRGDVFAPTSNSRVSGQVSGRNGFQQVGGDNSVRGNSYDKSYSNSRGFDTSFDDNGRHTNVGLSETSPRKEGYVTESSDANGYTDANGYSDADNYSNSFRYSDGGSDSNFRSTDDGSGRGFEKSYQNREDESDGDSYKNSQGYNRLQYGGKDFDVADGYSNNVNYDTRQRQDSNQGSFNTNSEEDGADVESYRQGVAKVASALASSGTPTVEPYRGLTSSVKDDLPPQAGYKPLDVNSR